MVSTRMREASPSRMIEPLPKLRSIWFSTSPRAFSRSAAGGWLTWDRPWKNGSAGLKKAPEDGITGHRAMTKTRCHDRRPVFRSAGAREIVRLYYSGFGPVRQGLIQPFWLERLDSSGQIFSSPGRKYPQVTSKQCTASSAGTARTASGQAPVFKKCQGPGRRGSKRCKTSGFGPSSRP